MYIYLNELIYGNNDMDKPEQGNSFLISWKKTKSTSQQLMIGKFWWENSCFELLSVHFKHDNLLTPQLCIFRYLSLVFLPQVPILLSPGYIF